MTYSGSKTPKMLLIAEAWGAEEESLRLPLVGTSGKENWKLLGEAIPDICPELHSAAANLFKYDMAWVKDRNAWMEEVGIGFTNVLNERPPNNELDKFCATKAEVGKDYPYPALVRGKYLRAEYFHHLDRLKAEIASLRPNLCLLLGNTACWALLRTIGITAIRGTTTWSDSFGLKCLATFHPASLLYEGQWSRRPIIIADYIKAYREAQYPEIRRTPRQILINPTLSEVYEWIEKTLSKASSLAIDCETSGGIIDTIGFASSESEALVIPFGVHRRKRGDRYVIIWPERDGKRVSSYWTLEEEKIVWNLIKMLLESPIPKVMQNGSYDIQYMFKMGICPANCQDDTMLAFHSMYPELQKSLGFLASMFCNEVAWKQFQNYKPDTEKRDE